MSDRLKDGIVIFEKWAFSWCLFVSVILHSGVLWHFYRFDSNLESPVSTIVLSEAPSDQGSASSETRRASGTRATTRSGKPGISADPSSDSDLSSLGKDSGIGNVVRDGAGVEVGGGTGSSTDQGGNSLRGSGSGGTPGSGTTRGRPETAGGKGSSPAPQKRVIEVPASLQRTTSPYESEVYAQVDFYTLFTADLRESVNVPGNQVCLDGNVIRTLDQIVLSHRVTDISKCRYVDAGDDQEKMRCPAEAHRTVVTFTNYLSSPVTFSVNICLLYDKSNCFWKDPGDGPEVEICKPRPNYEGHWAEGTMFHYKCMKSNVRTVAHPLEYEVRFLQDVEFPDERPRRRLVHREKRPVRSCE